MNNPTTTSMADNTLDPFVALKGINDSSNPVASNDYSLYVMMYPHKHLAQGHPGMIQVLKEYVRSFAEAKKRLVLITPNVFTLPPELEDDVAILDFDTASFAEMGNSFDTTFDALSCQVETSRNPTIGAEFRSRIVSIGGGMTMMEFENAVSRAIITHKDSLPEIDEDGFAAVVAAVKTEVVKRSEVLEVMQAESMANVGGLDLLKAWLEKRRLAFSDEAREFGIEPPKGIALIGPPGTGKSLIAKAISSVLGLPLIRFDISRIFKSLVGESEGRVRAALKMVDAMAPAVLLIDGA